MKIKELLEELKDLNPELEVCVSTRISTSCCCPPEQEYCYCNNYEDKELNINSICKKKLNIPRRKKNKLLLALV